MTAILGISAFYHDSAAALIVDGQIVAAAQEERFTRIKHDPAFPLHSIEYCLAEAGLKPADIDYIAFYEKPLTKFERLLETYLGFAPAGFSSFSMAIPVWLKEKLFLKKAIRKSLSGATRAKLVFTEHHESHAASAFFPSPYQEAAILTLDGVGEWCTTAWGVGRGNRLELSHQLSFPHSLGLLYSAITYHCGFKVNSGEYKLMGLAPYGKPVYVDLIRKHLIDIRPDGSFWMNMKFFNYCQGLTMTNRAFSQLFDMEPRRPESMLQQKHMDLAASVQRITEDIVLAMAKSIHQQTGMKHLVLAGGVALNCVANGKLLREGPFENIWIQPAAGDAGGALGAAQFVWYQLLDNPRQTDNQNDLQRGSLLGPRHDSDSIAAFLTQNNICFQRFENEHELVNYIAKLLADEKVIGWFQGRMEFGPRALGSRSIIGDARSPKMQAVMNLKIKYRESFRPFAPIVLKEKASEWFDIAPEHESPYMLLVADVAKNKQIPLTTEQQATMSQSEDLRERVNISRSQIPAVTHVDYSARLQTVDGSRNPRLHHLLKQFDAMTGCPVLVNTSFNVRGEPIVCTPQDAYRCFLSTEMDALVLEDCLILKTDIAPDSQSIDREKHLSQFALD
ncbi:MAG: Decarbamoylnovobiocin carbamoyltransferase [Planctomycetota bacterium]|jgi:carbamoyltransferase